MKELINIFSITLILFIQSCTAYQKQSFSLEESYNKGPVKIIYANRNWKKHDEIIFKDGIYYSINRKQMMNEIGNKTVVNLQTEIDPSNVRSIFIKDKKKSNRQTVWLAIIGIPSTVFLGVIIFFAFNYSV